MLLARTMELRPMGVWVWMGVVWGLGEGGVRPVGGGGVVQYQYQHENIGFLWLGMLGGVGRWFRV